MCFLMFYKTCKAVNSKVLWEFVYCRFMYKKDLDFRGGK